LLVSEIGIFTTICRLYLFTFGRLWLTENEVGQQEEVIRPSLIKNLNRHKDAMGRKAKVKKKTSTELEAKTTLPAKTKSTRKTTQKQTPTPPTKNKETQENNLSQEGRTDQDEKSSLSCSLAERVIQVPSNSVLKASVPQNKAQHDDAPTASVNFLKRGKNKNFNIIGIRTLTTWKISSGRKKSWSVCRRLKLSLEDLKLLTQSKNRPTSLGWHFSRMTSPKIVVRNQGVRIYEQSKRKTRKLTRGKILDDLEDTHEEMQPLLRDPAPGGSQWLQETKQPTEGHYTFFRLRFDHGHVSMTHEAFLEDITLYKYPTICILAVLVVIRLLRNESHADVYLAQNPEAPKRIYHAHAFLADVSGNWSTFSKRKMNRLRKSQGFYAETVQHGKKIIVMDAGFKADQVKAGQEFCMKNVQREFPPLPGTGKKPSTLYIFYRALGADDIF
jgi:hypothetical protein